MCDQSDGPSGGWFHRTCVEHQSVVSIRPIAVHGVYIISLTCRPGHCVTTVVTAEYDCSAVHDGVDSLNAWGVVSPCLCQRLSSVCQMRNREVCQFSAYSAINHTPRCVGCKDVRWVDMYQVQGSLLRGDQRTAWGRWGRLTSSVVYALPLPCTSAVICFLFVFRMDLH